MSISKSGQRKIFRAIAWVTFALIIRSLINGDFYGFFLLLTLAFSALSFASAHDAHLFPMDNQEAKDTPVNPQQRLFNFLTISATLIGAFVWYIRSFSDIL